MNVDERLGINTPMVVGEVIENEAILVNLDSGAYYSLNGTGSEIWTLIQENASGREIIEAMRGRYPGSSSQMDAVVERFLRSLQKENLIVTHNPPSGLSGIRPALLPTVEACAVPAFEKYTHMTDLLLLDPIHDVDEDGWPHANPELSARKDV